ncbi:MAG: protein kinase, partial [Myxococcales bacterium]|nr:protein kinase [Myxococcales bacterium]
MLDLIPKAGDQIGRYTLIRELGRGGFGVVYQARQAGLEIDVALKLMIPQAGAVRDPNQWAARFDQEAQVLKRLRHSSTIRILDTGKTDRGLPYFVLEFAQGKPLSN